MPATHILVLHDGGRRWVAQLLGQHRDRPTGRWMVGVRHYVAPGEQYQRVLWADDCGLRNRSWAHGVGGTERPSTSRVVNG